MSPRRVLIGLVAVAAALQASRLVFRWNQISLAYAAYFVEQRRIIEADGWEHAITTFVGLHPPAYTLLALGLIAASAPPLLWHGLSGLFSVVAVPAPARAERGVAHALWAAVLLAVSPYRVAYGLELNNYPLLVLTTALQLAAFARWSAAPDRRRLLVGTTALLVWTHALGVLLPAAQLLAVLITPSARPLRRSLATSLAWVALLCVPLVPGYLGALSGPPINAEVDLFAALLHPLRALPGRYGTAPAGWAFGALALWGALRSWREREPLVARVWTLHLTLGAAVLTTLTARGVSATSQLSYGLALLPSAALLAGRAVATDRSPRRLAARVAAAAMVAQVFVLAQAWWGAQQRRSELLQRFPITAEAIADSRAAGRALLLLEFPLHSDDDKDHDDPVWSLLPVNARLRWEHPGVPGLTPSDPYVGQPVLLGDTWLYSLATFDAERIGPIIEHHAAREGVDLVVYNTGNAPREMQRVRDFVGTRPEARAKLGPTEAWWRF